MEHEGHVYSRTSKRPRIRRQAWAAASFARRRVFPNSLQSLHNSWPASISVPALAQLASKYLSLVILLALPRLVRIAVVDVAEPRKDAQAANKSRRRSGPGAEGALTRRPGRLGCGVGRIWRALRRDGGMPVRASHAAIGLGECRAGGFWHLLA